MNTTDALARLEELQQELNSIEAQMKEVNPHSDQAILDDAWTEVTEEIETLLELIWNSMEDERSCANCSGCAYCEESAPGYDPADEI